MGLHRLLTEHGEAVRYDLLTMGRRLEDLDWLDVRALIRHSPPTSALYRARNPEWRVTDELLLLRDIEFRLRVLAWHNTDDGHKGRNAPTPILLTERERLAAKPESERYDPMPLDDMLAWLGWNRPSAN